MDFSEKKKKFQQRKLNMLLMFKEAIERRLSAVKATIETLEKQIDPEKDSD
tara:strand:+ start:874 stop:1026 length:153 start_codon:yes stop_codon:yes gene_type:complete